jgi:hypothetical protein
VADAARPGVDHHDDLSFGHAEALGRHRFRDLVDVLNLDEVIPGSHRAELRGAALLRTIGHGRGIGGLQPAAVFTHVDVGFPPTPALQREQHAVPKDAVHLAHRQREQALAADAARDVFEFAEEVIDPLTRRTDLDVASDQTHTARDVEPHAAR